MLSRSRQPAAPGIAVYNHQTMPLTSGTCLGPYGIVAPPGAGGVGEVYRMRDLRLNDGEPLRGGKLGLQETIDFTVQIVSGLEAAHDAGIVGRDLEPDNIVLTKDGRPKILDFGLANVMGGKSSARASLGLAGGSACPTNADETSTVRTEAGGVMGTAGYSSLEQVRGAATKHRSDIFSMGVILYELLAGTRAFQAGRSVETMTAILKERWRQIVANCLEKDTNECFPSARDLRFAFTSLIWSGGRRWLCL